jgi:hypothetical membrane protein
MFKILYNDFEVNKMENLFYNIVSFILGLLTILYTVLNWKNNKVIFKSLLLVFAVIFLALGVIGFIIPTQYGVFLIIGMLFLVIATVATLIISNKWNEAEKNKEQ